VRSIAFLNINDDVDNRLFYYDQLLVDMVDTLVHYIRNIVVRPL